MAMKLHTALKSPGEQTSTSMMALSTGAANAVSVASSSAATEAGGILGYFDDIGTFAYDC